MSNLHTSLEVFLGHEAYTDDRERQLRALADAIPLIVWTADPNGELDYYNRQWEIYTGFSAEETMGWGWAPVLHPDDLQRCIERWTQAFTSGEPYEIEYRFKRAQDGSYRWHLGRATPFKDENGAILKWFGTGTDIDDQVQGRERLNQAYTEIEKVVEARTAELAAANQMLTRQNEVRKEAVEALQQDSLRLNEIITTQYKLAEAILDHEAFIMLVIERIALLTHAHGAVFELVEGDEAVYKAATGTIQHHLGLRLKLVHSLSGLCILSGQVLSCNDTETDPRVDLEACRKIKARSMVAAPLIHAGKPVGVLKIMSELPDAFSERDIQTLQLMAGLIGAAIGHQADFEANRKLLLGRTEALDALNNEIEHRARVEATIRDNEWRTRMIIESSYDAFIAIDQHGAVSDWNQQAETIFGWSRQEALGAVLADLICPEPYRQAHYLGMQHFLKTGEGSVLNKPIELVGLHRGGEEFPVELTIRAMQFKEGYEFCAFLRDITERKALEQKLLQLSQSDPLTGVPNRHIFNDRMGEAMKRCTRNKTRLALLYLDIDHFKAINDEYGHKTGDAILKEFTQRLRNAIRASDTLVRLGSDEFVIILEGLKHNLAAEKMASKILDSIRADMQVEDTRLAVTTTIGVAYYDGEPDPEQFLDKADKALYRAKQAGRNRIGV